MVMCKAFTSLRSFVPPSLSPCHLVSVAWWHHFHLTEERWSPAYPYCPYAVSLLIPSRPYRASLVHVSLPPSRTLEGYFLLCLPIAYGEWQHAYAPSCTSPCLSQWAPAPWPCLDMDYPRIPHPNSYKPKPNGLSPLCHLLEESDSFLLSSKVNRLHINLFCFHLFEWQSLEPFRKVGSVNFYTSFKPLAWPQMPGIYGLEPGLPWPAWLAWYLAFLQVHCLFYIPFSTKIHAKLQPNCQCKWSSSLLLIIISFLLCLIVASLPFIICRLTWPWDACLERRQYRESLW